MYTYILYGSAAGLLLLSFVKDRGKTRKALKKSLKSIENIMPQFLCVLVIVGMTLAFLDERTISRHIGNESGLMGMFIAAVIGSISLIPGFLAFALAASLLKAGAGYGQIAMFVTTLMAVGVVTLPVESAYFGRRTAVSRNLLALVLCACVSLAIEALMR